MPCILNLLSSPVTCLGCNALQTRTQDFQRRGSSLGKSGPSPKGGGGGGGLIWQKVDLFTIPYGAFGPCVCGCVWVWGGGRLQTPETPLWLRACSNIITCLAWIQHYCMWSCGGYGGPLLGRTVRPILNHGTGHLVSPTYISSRDVAHSSCFDDLMDSRTDKKCVSEHWLHWWKDSASGTSKAINALTLSSRFSKPFFMQSVRVIY